MATAGRTGGLGGCDSVVQEASPTGSATPEPRQVKPRDARHRFDEVYNPWRTVVGELVALDLQYQAAAPHRRDELRPRFEQLVAEGRACEDEVFQAALAAYAQAPAENPDLVEFLLGSVFMLVQAEEYEAGLRAAQVLLDGGVAFGQLFALAGKAAFATGEFELAEQHIRRAAQEKAMLDEAHQLLRDIDYYKTAWDREKQLRSAERAADDLPRVLLRTTQGEIELELFENEAPNTVATFVWLVERGFYDGLTFYRVVAQLIAEAGCPNGDGTGEAGYPVPVECHAANQRLHFRGSLAMLPCGQHASGSRFYLVFVPRRQLDGQHTVFGRIVRGIDVLAKLQRREPPDPFTLEVNPHSNIIVPPADKIIAAKVLRKRNHPYQPLSLRTRETPGSQRPAGS